MSEQEQKPVDEQAPAQEAPAQEAPAQEAPAAQEEAKADEGGQEQPAEAEDAKPEDSKAEDPAAEGGATEPAQEAAQEPAKEQPAPEMPASPKKVRDVEPAIEAKGEDEYYPDGFKAKELPDTQISKRNFAFHGVYGIPSMKRYNIHFLSTHEIIFVTGNKYQTYNMQTQKFETFHGKDRDGVGSIAVHPSRKFFAVAEKGTSPNIYIYEYPSLKLYRVLTKGTEQRYAHVEFSNTGEKMVSLGGAPDFTITVWNWKAERVILKAKAYSQTIYRASFSPYTDDVLFTAGLTHMKFWKMAQTFTGLKLQGEIAKFGALEMSNVSGYHELPDGKVLSGTEQGNMILWEGNLVKAHLVLEQETKKPLHNGMVEVILFENDEFITAAHDGYIKWWSLAEIDQCEADEVLEVAIAPTKSTSIKTSEGDYAQIINMVRGDNFWLIQDFKGRLWKLDFETLQSQIVLDFHSGRINDMAISDCGNMSVTVGQDGNIKFWDYVRGETLGQQQFNGSANCVDLIRRSDLNRGRVAAVGYDSGIVRVVSIKETNVELNVVFKAHDSPVIRIAYSPAQTMLVTCSREGEIFFFETNGHADLQLYEPLCMLRLPEKNDINDMKWDQNSTKIIVACQSGYVYEICKPNRDKINNTESFEIQLSDCQHRVWKMKMMEFQMKKNQKKDEEEEERKRRLRLRGQLNEQDEDEDEDWDPDAITAISWVPDKENQFIIGSKGQYAGFFYLCDFTSERPVTAYEMPKEATIKYISFNNFGDLLNIGLNNGEIRISYGSNPRAFLAIKEHDGEIGQISAAKLSYDERFLVSTGYDGLIFVHTIDKFMIQQESRFNPLEGVEGTDFMPEDQVKEITKQKINTFQQDNPPNLPDIDPHVDGLDKANLHPVLKIPKDAKDIVDETVYSIQQAKLRTEEDRKLEIAEEKKAQVRSKIQGLRDRFSQVVAKNMEVEEVIRVQDQDFNIDPEYFNMLIQRSKDKIEETKKEEQWEVEKNTVKLNKIKKKFYDILDFQKWTVKAMRTGAYVTTFRVPKMSEFLTQNINEFKAILESEIAAKEENEMNENDMLNQMDDGAEGEKGIKDKAKATVTASGQPGQVKVHKTHADQRREERKIQRELRKKKIDKLKTKEVMQRGEDKTEKAKIEEARRTFGLYQLKMAEDYEVPESEQVDYKKKRQQMILLEGSIHKIKVDFNIKVNDLRVRKQDIIAAVKTFYERLDSINEELGTPETLVLPETDEKVEYPEKAFNVTDGDIENYRAELKQREIDAKNKDKGQGGKKKKQQQAEAEKQAKDKAEAEKAAKKKEGDATANEQKTVDPYQMRLADRKGRTKHVTELDEEMLQVRMIELKYEKEQLVDNVNTQINDFDDEIKEMQKEKYRLESDLKSAELKLLLLFEELILLKSMQPEDMRLSNELKKCTEQKGFIIKEIQDISRKLISKRAEVEDIKEEEAKLLAQFHELVDTNHENYDQILAFYEKITKKRRKPERMKQDDPDGDEDGDEAEEEEIEEDDDDDDDDNFNPQFGEDMKLDEIERLRDSRLTLFDQKEAIQLFISDLQNQEKRMEGKQKNIDQELQETEEQIKDFQKEKMAKLNQLHMAVVLKIKQIQNLIPDGNAISRWFTQRQQQLFQREKDILEGHIDIDDGEGEVDRQQYVDEQRREALASEDWRGHMMPETLDRSVLFTRTQLLKLIHRKLELDEEIITFKKEQVEAENNYKEEKKKISQYNKQLEEKIREYRERQMLRFGNIVDLDSLEVSGPSQIVLDLQNKFHKMEQRCNRKKEEAEADLSSTQRDLTGAITMNTNLLDMIKQLGSKQLQLNRQLDSTNKQIFDNEDEEEKRNIQMKKDIFRAQLESQTKEIEILKTEINLYKKKGGHIYTKVTTNRRVAHLNDN